jgi:CubicO group peptidase (beta-lactamase class C family)
MKNTSFNFSRLDINQVAIPYQRYMGRYYTINELLGNRSSSNKYWRVRFYPAGGLYTTVSDLSHFLIAHMNGGVYNGTQILKKQTVELMHETQPNNSWYGLAWMHRSIGGLNVTGHPGDLPGADTWMFYNQTEDIGVIYLANGNPYYSALPFGGFFPVRLILDSLFTKERTLRGEDHHDLTVLSDPFFITPLMVPRPMLYGHNYN